MKKLFCVAISVLLLMTVLTACSSKGASLDKIQKAGKLTIATSPDFPPFESLDGDGKVTGIEIDLL